MSVLNSSNYNSWVSMWGNAVSIAEGRPEGYTRDITLRYPVYAPFDGDLLKITFDNYCGLEPVTISRATVAIADFDLTAGNPGLSCPQRDAAEITFNGAGAVVMDAGASVVSDPISLSVNAGDTLCVNIYFKEYTSMRSAVVVTGPLSTGFYSLGDATDTAALDHMTTKKINMFYFLSNIDIHTSSDNHAIICYGDSITAQDWPDYLTLRVKDLGYKHTSIIRRATSGSRILRQYECITYNSYGLKSTNRFDHEIPTAGADAVIIQQGINDIIHPVGTDVNEFRPMSDLPTVDELAEGLKWYVDKAHALGMKAYIGTLLPIHGWRTYAPFREDLKNQLNDWMRHYTEADGCIDFDAALRDDKNPTAFRAGFDSGDHLHPSSTAYKAMADTVPDILFK